MHVSKLETLCTLLESAKVYISRLFLIAHIDFASIEFNIIFSLKYFFDTTRSATAFLKT